MVVCNPLSVAATRSVVQDRHDRGTHKALGRAGKLASPTGNKRGTVRSKIGNDVTLQYPPPPTTPYQIPSYRSKEATDRQACGSIGSFLCSGGTSVKIVLLSTSALLPRNCCAVPALHSSYLEDYPFPFRPERSRLVDQ